MSIKTRLEMLERKSGIAFKGIARLQFSDHGILYIDSGQYAGRYPYKTNDGNVSFPGVKGDLLKFLQKKMTEPVDGIVLEIEIV